MREKIKPVLDVPLLLQMETVAGQESPSQFSGMEYRFDVVYERRPAQIYLPPEGCEAIRRARPQVGDYLELLKQRRGNQNIFRASIVADATAGPPPLPQPTQQQQTLPIGVTRGAAALRSDEGAVRRVSGANVAAPGANTLASGSRAPLARHAETSAAQPTPPPTVYPLKDRLLGCLLNSFDAWEELRAYALERGVALEYTTADLRATANTFFLEALRGAR